MSSQDLHNEISEILKNNEPVDRHSYFQLKHFVIDKEPTVQSKMWRCLRELQARKDSIDGIKIEIEDSIDRKMLLEIQIEKCSRIQPDLDISEKEIEIKVRRLKRKLGSIEKSIDKLNRNLKYAEDEAMFFMMNFKKINEYEQIKNFDDKECQNEYWSNKFYNELNIQILLGQPINIELAKSILSLQDNNPVKESLVKLLANDQKVLKNNE